jgi:hypothetical protein
VELEYRPARFEGNRDYEPSGMGEEGPPAPGEGEDAGAPGMIRPPAEDRKGGRA